MENTVPEKYIKGLVSVIIPVYNRTDLLREALQSVCDQTYRPIECIVADDGSSEDIRSVVEETERATEDLFLQFRYYRQQNAGAPAARNLGTGKCNGEFIQYLDSDDLLPNDKISKQVDFLSHNKEIAGVFGDWETGSPEKKELITGYVSDDLISQVLGLRCIPIFSFLMRRDIVRQIGPWDIELKRNQEVDYHLRGLIMGFRFAYQSINTGYIRTNAEARISDTTGLEPTLFFFRKWVRILNENEKLNNERKKIISSVLTWAVINEKKSSPEISVKCFQLALELDPELPVMNTPRMKLMRLVLGSGNAIRLWIKKHSG